MWARCKLLNISFSLSSNSITYPANSTPHIWILLWMGFCSAQRSLSWFFLFPFFWVCNSSSEIPYSWKSRIWDCKAIKHLATWKAREIKIFYELIQKFPLMAGRGISWVVLIMTLSHCPQIVLNRKVNLFLVNTKYLQRIVPSVQ